MSADRDPFAEIQNQFRGLRAHNDQLATAVYRAVKLLGRDMEYQAQLAATASSAEYVRQHMASAKMIRGDRNHARPGEGELLLHALGLVSIDGFYAEFGVWQGKSLSFLAEHVGDRRIYGFDSFEGLPEDWSVGHPKGSFDLGGVLPELKTTRGNVELVKGWFEDTLPGFAGRVTTPAAFLHIDCDLYSSTKTILDVLGDRIVAGTVIVFDEYLNHPGWQEGEVKAWREFCEARRVRYRYCAYTTMSESVAVVVDQVG